MLCCPDLPKLSVSADAGEHKWERELGGTSTNAGEHMPSQLAAAACQQDDGAAEKTFTGVDWYRHFSSELAAMHTSLAQLVKEQRMLAAQEVMAELTPRLRADKASMLRAIRELLREHKQCERCHGMEGVSRASDRTTRKETAHSRFPKPATAYAKTTVTRSTMRTEMYQASQRHLGAIMRTDSY